MRQRIVKKSSSLEYTIVRYRERLYEKIDVLVVAVQKNLAALLDHILQKIQFRRTIILERTVRLDVLRRKVGKHAHYSSG